MGTVTALTGALELTETAPTLATMLGLAVGIDYALFILSRHRQNIHDGMEPREAAAQATGTAGSAVVFAGATVVIALVGLVVVNIPFLTVMGLAAAGAVVVAVLIATTLLPACSALPAHGSRASTARSPGGRPASPSRETASLRYARFVTRRPLVVTLLCVAACWRWRCPRPTWKLGLPDGGSKLTDNTERKAYDLLTEGFGPGFNGVRDGGRGRAGVPRRLQDELATGVADGIKEFPNVAAVSEPAQNEAGDVTIVSVTPKTGPALDETRDLVDYMHGRGPTRSRSVTASRRT